MNNHTLLDLWTKTITLIICAVLMPIGIVICGLILSLIVICLVAYCLVIAFVGFWCSVLASILYYCDYQSSVDLINWTYKLFEKIEIDESKSKDKKEKQPEDLKTNE